MMLFKISLLLLASAYCIILVLAFGVVCCVVYSGLTGENTNEN